MTTFYLIRHAEKSVSGNVLSGRAAGVHLTDRGRRQADELAERLAAAPIQRVCSSPLERALDTARPLAQRRGLEVEVTDALGEFDFGGWTNQTVEALEPDPEWQRFSAFRSGNRAPGGDHLLGVQARFVDEMLRLHEAAPDAGIALVSHSDPIRAAVAFFTGSPLDLFLRFEIAPASVTVIALGEWGPHIRCINSRPVEERW